MKSFFHPLMENNISEQDISAVLTFLKKNKKRIFTQSEKVSQFEKSWSRWLGVKYSIFVKSLKTKKIDMFEEVHEMRHFSIPEIAAIAEQNSFKVLSVKEFLTDKPASINSFGVCFSLEKN